MTFSEFLSEWRNNDDTVTARTSGSTGNPKEIRLSKDFLRASAMRTNRYFSINERSRLHSCVSPDFIGGKMMAVRSEISGALLTWETPSNRALEMESSTSLPIDLLAVVPSQMISIIERHDKLPQINAIIIGGSSIHPDLRMNIAASGLNCFETYGMTETASHIALRRVSAGEEWFETLPGISVSLDSRGCLVISLPLSDNPESPMTVVTTNDIAELCEEDGKKFRILGRYDNMIITGGKKVNPEKLEQRIHQLTGLECLVTSEPDEKWGERIVLKIESKTPIDISAIESRLKKDLAPHEAPKSIITVPTLPRTPNGKLKRK